MTNIENGLQMRGQSPCQFPDKSSKMQKSKNYV